MDEELSMDDVRKQLLSQLGLGKERKIHFDVVLGTLSADFVARRQEINSRIEALVKDVVRIRSQIDADKARWWADVLDKYGLHGKDIHIDDKTGHLHEITEE